MSVMFDPIKFAERVRVAMARAHLGQNETGRLLGLSPVTMSRVCNGIGEPELSNYLTITAWLEKVEK